MSKFSFKAALMLVLSLIFVFTPLIPSEVAFAADAGYSFTVDEIKYTVLENTRNVKVAGHGPESFFDGVLIIPDTVSDGKNTYSVTEIADAVFANCNSLETITIPDSVTEICRYAFSTCTGLTRLEIGNGVKTIGHSAFTNCNLLRSVTIPDSVTSVGPGAFMSCDCLENITIGSAITDIGYEMFADCFSLGSVTIPDTVLSINTKAFSGCANLISVSMGDGLNTIGGLTFDGCSRLESIIIGPNVREIGSFAFFNCSRLTKLVVPDSVKKIGEYPFNIYSRSLTYDGNYGDQSKVIAIYANEGSYAQAYAEDNKITFVPVNVDAYFEKTATTTQSTVEINGTSVPFQAYNIDGSNYFKLRDLAYALRDTAKQFEVEWDSKSNAILLTGGKAYTEAGGELSVSDDTSDKAAAKTKSTIYLNKKSVKLKAYNIAGNNYFMLRDIGKALNFGVDWDGTTNTIRIDTTKGYTP